MDSTVEVVALEIFSFLVLFQGTTLDIDIPFSYDLPASVTTARKLEDEHAAVLEMAEDLMNK